MKEEQEFTIRSYSKSELAALYMPDISPQSAVKAINKWIAKYPGLKESLTETGLMPADRKYTPLQVRLIVEALGEP